MKNELVTYILNHVELSEELQKIVVETSNIKTFKKGSIILRERIAPHTYDRLIAMLFII